MLGNLCAVAPSLVVWVIWKEYATIRYGDSSYSYRRLFDRVRDHIYTWCAMTQGRKFSQPLSQLIALAYSPPLRVCRHKLVRWELLPLGKMKLNVDASLGRHKVATRAILYNACGDFISAICFALPCVLPIRAESMAMLYGLIFYAQIYDGHLVETDCRTLLNVLSNPSRYTGQFLAEIRCTSNMLCINASTLCYWPREANTVAYTLAPYGLHAPGVILYSSITALPYDVRGALAIDESLPSFRLYVYYRLAQQR